MTKQSLKDNVISNEIQTKKFWSLTTPKMCFYWRLLKKKFENIEGNFLAHVQEKQDIFLEQFTLKMFESAELCDICLRPT